MIAYDTNVLIYALEGTSPWSAQAQTVIEQGEQEGAILSVLAWQELMTGAVLNDADNCKKLATILDEFNSTKFTPVSLSISKRAVALTKQYGKQVYGYDAIHIANAIEHKAKSFITNDQKLLSLNIKEIEICSL
jgi:predicted nucleic acid-binding protein